VHLSPIFPSASVVLPSLALRSLSPRERARVAAAGCWHNLLFAVLLWSACAVLGSMQGYVGDIGRVVLQVDRVRRDDDDSRRRHLAY
jgi:S2P endopeptidase